jgi:pimeloyl-ACP methyl ester carboxylesterase
VLVGAGGLGLTRPAMAELKNWRRIESPEARLDAHRTNLGILMLHDPANVDELAVHLQSQNTSRCRINSRAISRTDTLRRALADTDAALAGIWGVHDATSGAHLHERVELLRSLDSEAEFVRIDAGHWVAYEAPDAFNAALTELLQTPRTRAAA